MTEPDFLQSADWARFQAAVGHEVVKADVARFFETPLPLGGSYLYCPHPDVQSADRFIDQALQAARVHGAWFIRVEPNIGSARIWNLESGIWNGRPTTYDLRPTMPVQPADTWHVPLGSDEQMLTAMHEKTRYNIRVAERKGVTVRFSSNPTDVEILTTLLGKTGERTGIRIHPSSYYTTMLQELGARHEIGDMRHEANLIPHTSYLPTRLTVDLAVAEIKDQAFDQAQAKPIAVALVAHYGDRSIYLHGGSDYAQRALMAPYALHWAVMQRARDAGAAVYDMGGVAPAEPEQISSKQQAASGGSNQPFHLSPLTVHSPHPWAGITRFKTGFGGATVHYPPAVDVVVNRTMYSIYQLGRLLGRMVR